jgi:hypothetical protein
LRHPILPLDLKFIFLTLIVFAADSFASIYVSKPLPKDELLYSFVVIGCNRLDRADTATAVNPSTANVEQLKRTFHDIANLKPVPKLFFFTGDLVIGYAKDTSKLGSELRAWKKLYENSELPATGIRLVAMPGNHESMRKKKEGKATQQAEECWVNNMAPYIAGSNGPKKGGPDNLQSDQSRLTYSFDYKDTHFLVLNTDPVGAESRVPNAWIAADLAKTGKNKISFALGHKPAYAPPNETGMDEYPAERDKFWSILEDYNCKAMITAHCHQYYRIEPHSGKTWQIIAGNGGSVLDDGLTPEQTYFGYTLINVYKSGSIEVKGYGRPLPKQGYAAKADNTPTTVRDSFWIKN